MGWITRLGRYLSEGPTELKLTSHFACFSGPQNLILGLSNSFFSLFRMDYVVDMVFYLIFLQGTSECTETCKGD